MASLKEIRAKVASIKSTQKITRAMQMVAASKMRRAQERMQLGRPYADSMRRVVSHLVKASPDYKHPYLVPRAVNRVGYIVVSSDRGLAGGLNINLFKKLMQHVKQQKSQSVETRFAVIGQKGVSFFKTFGGTVIAAETHYGDNPSFEQLSVPVQVMLDAYNRGEIDEIYMVYNKFVNAMTQNPSVQRLLPIAAESLVDETMENREYSWDYIYEPTTKEVLEGEVEHDVEAIDYQGMVENVAAEQYARMVAMKAATDNAGNLMNELQWVDNKLRQAAITREISEIVGGAAAVS